MFTVKLQLPQVKLQLTHANMNEIEPQSTQVYRGLPSLLSAGNQLEPLLHRGQNGTAHHTQRLQQTTPYRIFSIKHPGAMQNVRRLLKYVLAFLYQLWYISITKVIIADITM